MKPIEQEHPSGCAVACIAYILHCKYKDALSLFANGTKKAKNTGFYHKEIIGALKKRGVECSYFYINHKTKKYIYIKDSIVFIKRSALYPAGHYLVRSDGKWMDPWINYHNNKDIRDVKAGFRKKLPDTPIYVIVQTA